MREGGGTESADLGVGAVHHRLDLSVQRVFDLSFGTLEARGGAMNLYDRRNVFFFDVFTLKRVDQLPLFPYLAVKFTAG